MSLQQNLLDRVMPYFDRIKARYSEQDIVSVPTSKNTLIE